MLKARDGRAFDLHCIKCPRLASHLQDVRQKFPKYHARPVAPFGPRGSRVLIIGLAPGLHGANATGRPFTGDHCGLLLYQTLHKHGFANQSESVHRKDGLQLINCRITNAVKCLPPANKPIGAEVNQCTDYLQRDIAQIGIPGVILVLGGVAHRATLKALGLKQSTARFAHGQVTQVAPDLKLISSYHCSRYNTQTKRLTIPMFDQIFVQLRQLLEH